MRRTASAAALFALVLTGCTATDDESLPALTTDASTGATSSASPSEPPSLTAPPQETAVAPAQTVAAGALDDGSPTSASGTGPALVTFSTPGTFALVAGLDCSACTGDVRLTQEGRMSPYGEGPAPLTGSYLVDVLADSPVDSAVIVDAEGPWTLTLSSWNDLEPLAGAQQGTGSTVVWLGDEALGFDVTWTPADPDDSFSGRAFSAVATTDLGPDSRIFGDTNPFSETFDLALPGVIAISTRGTWTVTPLP